MLKKDLIAEAQKLGTKLKLSRLNLMRKSAIIMEMQLLKGETPCIGQIVGCLHNNCLYRQECEHCYLRERHKENQ